MKKFPFDLDLKLSLPEQSNDPASSWVVEALNFLAQGVTVYDADNRLAYANRAYAEIYGFDGDALPLGCRVSEVFRRQARALTDCPARQREYVDHCHDHLQTRPGERQMSEISVLRQLPDGRMIQIERREVEGGYSIATHEDVSEQLSNRREVEHAACFDELTSLPNRQHFTRVVIEALSELREGDGLSLLLIDLDRFKQVNDFHGHGVGDELLQQVSKRLLETVRSTDACGRLGGDEFAVLLSGVEGSAGATRLAERIVDELSKPYHCDGATIVTGVSVGVALADAHHAGLRELMKEADFALYRAKADGRGRYQLFEDQLGQELADKRRIEAAMRRALITDGFTLNFQPIVNIERGRVEVVEALLRWELDGCFVSPGLFIPIAEENGMILALGDWVLHRACEAVSQLPQHVAVAVNVSPIQFRSGDVIGSVRNALKETGLSPSRLQIEVTESLLLEDATTVRGILDELATIGCSIALDDFGTGYSSLNYLTNFPFDKIKVDRSFIQDLPGQSRKLAVFEAIADLGRGLGVATTIEGVETTEQLNLVQRKSCTEVQGFLLAKPTSSNHLASYIAEAETTLKNSRPDTPSRLQLVS